MIILYFLTTLKIVINQICYLLIFRLEKLLIILITIGGEALICCVSTAEDENNLFLALKLKDFLQNSKTNHQWCNSFIQMVEVDQTGSCDRQQSDKQKVFMLARKTDWKAEMDKYMICLQSFWLTVMVAMILSKYRSKVSRSQRNPPVVLRGFPEPSAAKKIK